MPREASTHTWCVCVCVCVYVIEYVLRYILVCGLHMHIFVVGVECIWVCVRVVS